jgi:benzoyl-CoA 2,3-epoxidase subunit B
MYTGLHLDLDGTPVSKEYYEQHVGTWLPTAEDREYVHSLMVPCHEQGKFAGWIAPPPKGINSQPTDFDYVRL